MSSIFDLVTQHRLVSVVGAGGVGKTTVALASAHALRTRFRDGAYFVDLASISEPQLVPFAVASTLRASIETDRPLQSLVSLMRDSQALVLLDNCEHVIGAAAELADALLRGAPGLHILTTSHEPLRSDGERIFRLSPFDLPDDLAGMSLDEALAFPAIDLFVDRAKSDQMSWRITDEDVPFIAEICRSLDGIPLAIEMAASRAEVFGISDLASRLDDRFELLTGGKRTAAARQQTIRSTLDWSYENLTTGEKVILRRLGIFSGSFSLAAAHMVVGDETLNPFSITDGLAGLVRKSVVSLRPSDGRVAYRLLESVRLYALEKLSAANEIDRVRQLHMGYLLDLLETATTEWTFTPRSQWLATYGAVLDDVRSALAWAFADPEDISSGVLLTTLAMPIGLQLGLVDEFRLRIETAIAASRRARKAELVAEMRLNLVYGILNQNQIHPNSASAIGIERAVELAEEIDSDLYRIEPQIVLGSYSMGMGDYPKALGHASRAHALSATVNDDIALLASRRILSQVTHFSGQHAKAVDLAYTVLQHPLVNIPVAFGSVQTDRRISMRIVLARSRWMQGFADEAYSIANEAIAIAPEDGPLALCQALSLGAVPLLLWRGDREEARSRSEILIDQASRYTLRHWHSWGLLFQAVLGDQDSRDRLSIAPQGGLQRETVATFTGRLEDSFVENDVVQASWSAPEHLRLLGERALAANLPDHVATAEWFFLSSRALAISHGALAWELRATSSLARLWRFTPRRVEGMDQLGAVLSRFIEGHSTVDVKTANSLLRSIEEQ